MKELLLNPIKCQKLGIKGYEMVEKKFNNNLMGERIFDTYNSVLNLKSNMDNNET